MSAAGASPVEKEMLARRITMMRPFMWTETFNVIRL
jgi:hypothetical protein